MRKREEIRQEQIVNLTKVSGELNPAEAILVAQVSLVAEALFDIRDILIKANEPKQ